ncbi:MAG: complex I subunit 5 family protein [Limnochordia bacterium]
MSVAEVRSYLPLAAIALPFLGALAVILVDKYARQWRDWTAPFISGIVFVLVVQIAFLVNSHQIIRIAFEQIMPPFGLSLRVDPLSLALGLIASFVWFLVSIYSMEYMKGEQNVLRYYTFFLLNLGACLGVLFAGDLLTLFLFFEAMSLSSFVLVIHEGTQQALRAGYRYLFMMLTGGLSLLYGIILVFGLLGTVTFTTGGLIHGIDRQTFIAFTALLFGFGMKAGVFPLHIWLPEAHPVAPSPASALLSGIMIKVGAYGLLRVLYNIFSPAIVAAHGWNNVLLILAGITMLLGSLLAIAQRDLKRRLAYSSIGQMGYIILGMSLLTERGLIGDIFHILSHAVIKSCLFLAAGAIITKTGKRNIDELQGIGYEMPVTMASFTIGALAMVGIPPMNGFISKWLLGLGSLDAHRPWYAVLLLISSLLNAVYYFPIIINAFLRPSTTTKANDASLVMLVPMVILAVTTFFFDIIPTNLPLEISEVTALFLFNGRG